MKNKILVYDDNCPLCKWYTSAFVKYGLLAPEERKPFSTIDASCLTLINFEKGKNEIPLIDKDSGEVLYGIDAMLEILGQKWPVLKKTGNQKPVKWFLRHLYKFISYNRKVIVAKKCSTGAIDCSPAFNFKYRLLFMGVFLLFNTIMLFSIHKYILSNLSFYKLTIVELQLAHFGLVMINCLLATTLPIRKAIEYLGQVNMLALLSILMMLPLLFLCSFFTLPGWSISLLLFLQSLIIFKEYLRRMDYAGILISYKWLAGINISCILVFLVYLFH